MSEQLNYKMEGDFQVPDLDLEQPEEADKITKYGIMRMDYLENYHEHIYTRLLFEKKLFKHALEIQEAAEKRQEEIVEQMCQKEGVDEKLKAQNPIAWVQRRENIIAQAEEIVIHEIVCAKVRW